PSVALEREPHPENLPPAIAFRAPYHSETAPIPCPGPQFVRIGEADSGICTICDPSRHKGSRVASREETRMHTDSPPPRLPIQHESPLQGMRSQVDTAHSPIRRAA